MAHVLARLCRAAGHKVLQVYARQQQVGTALAAEAGGTWHPLPLPQLENIHICIIAVSDGAIAQLAAQAWQPHTMVVHTAGAVPLHALQGAARRYGVLYPLQSLRAQKIAYPQLPLLIDGNTPWVRQSIAAFARSLSPRVQLATDAERLHYHLAAVLASNFTNHLYTLAATYCTQKGLDFNTLLPLIDEVTQRLHRYPPHAMQTGPALRGDTGTMEKHLALINENKSLYELYRLFSASIRDFHTLQAQKSPAEVQTAGPMASNS